MFGFVDLLNFFVFRSAVFCFVAVSFVLIETRPEVVSVSGCLRLLFCHIFALTRKGLHQAHIVQLHRELQPLEEKKID